MSYCVSDSQYNCQKSTCSDFKSKLCWCTMTDEFSSAAMWYRFVQTEHSHWAQEWSWSEKSEHTEQAAADQQRELN